MTIFISRLLYGGWMHLLGNMLYLWIFGNKVEHGAFRVCPVLSPLWRSRRMRAILPNPASKIPMIGASGAISSISGAYLLLHPHTRFLVLIPFGFFSQLIRIKTGWVLGIWFAFQLFDALQTNGNAGGVTFGAHIGGFIAGIVLAPFSRNKDIPI